MKKIVVYKMKEKFIFMIHTWMHKLYEQTIRIKSFSNDYDRRYYEIKDSSKRFVDTINSTNDLRIC